MARVCLRGVGKAYEQVRVLEPMDLEVADGELLVLVGPSGCGKSTLLRCIAGLEDLTEGSITLDDRPIHSLPPQARDMAMVFQSYALYPHMTVRENMGFSLSLKGTSSAMIDHAVSEAAGMLGLESLLERHPRELSGGQRQRVAIGRAVVRKPRVFLFDEPLSNLDAGLRTRLRVELKRLHQNLGATMFYVTHDQVEAMTLADRIAVLEAGVLQQVGTPQELYDAPVNRFVAGFIGTPAMSFLANVEPDVILGVRAHQVRLGDGPLQATVEVIEPLGHESHVHLDYQGQPLIARIEGPPPAPGPIGVSLVNPFRFDPTTGQRRAGL